MFLRNESKPDPKQQALDNVLMMIVHKKMSAPTQSKRSMKPSYPPARNGATNFEPGFSPKPMSRKGGAANPDIMKVLAAYMGSDGRLERPAPVHRNLMGQMNDGSAPGTPTNMIDPNTLPAGSGGQIPVQVLMELIKKMGMQRSAPARQQLGFQNNFGDY